MTNKTIIIIIILTVITCFLSVWIFTSHAFVNNLSLSSSDKANIGSAIGGITAPIIGLFSTILLILTLNKQIDSYNDQKLKNESDIIFALINQLETELSNFYHTYTTRNTSKEGEVIKNEIRMTGVEALNEWTRQFRRNHNSVKDTFKFGHFYQSNQLLLLIHSFQLVQKRIDIAFVRNDIQYLFLQKLNSFYECRLYYPLKKISEAMQIYPSASDIISDE
jgi:hypothetical protein